MVSLYRAWAAWRGFGVPGAPDAMVQVGGVRFAAHARLLAAHSGYFKSVLTRPWNPLQPVTFQTPANPEDTRGFEEAKTTQEIEPYEASYERDRREYEARYEGREGVPQISDESIVYVPNISAQQFWPLLAYMYTGYLELTPENIYQVLLATHLLHMPRALELCRNYLAQGAAAPLAAPATTVVKPIASRKMPPYLPPAVYRPIYPEPSIPFLGSHYDTPFKPLETQTRLSDISETTKSQEDTQDNSKEQSHITEQIAKENIISQSEVENINVNLNPVSHTPINLIKARKPKQISKLNLIEKNEEATLSKAPPDTSVILKEKGNTKINSSHGDDKVVVDVACCDGPVRFHRVLNSAYKGNGAENAKTSTDSSDTDDSYIEIEEDSRSQSDTPYDNCNAFSKSLQKQMSENIRLVSKHNENRPSFIAGEELVTKEGQDPETSNSDVSSKCPQDTIYTCVYCNHTFKSQYCYQKHARRHINPVSIDAVNQGTLDMTDGCCKIRKLSKVAGVSSGPRREVRLLDMNVQYYPCKTCGSKFPSYYFVHKHRKMCHAEELDNAPESSKPTSSGEKRRKLSSSGNASKDETPVEDNNEGTSNKTTL